MTPNPRFLLSSDPLSLALDLFQKKQFKTLPVLTADRRVVGVLTEVALLKSLVISISQRRLDSSVYEYVQHFEQATPVNERDTLNHVLKTLLASKVNRLLVLDSQEKLVGIISPKDIIGALLNDSSHVSLQNKVDALEDELRILRQNNAQLKEKHQSLDDLKNLMESSMFLTHSVGPDGKIHFANQRIHQVLGYPDGSLLGQDFEILYPSHIRPLVKKSFAELSRGDTQKIVYSALSTKDNMSIKVEMTSIALRKEDGTFNGTATVSRIIDSEVMLKLLSGAFKS